MDHDRPALDDQQPPTAQNADEVSEGGSQQLRRNAQAQVLPRMPEVLSDADLRRVRRSPRLPVSVSYADQEYRVTDGGGATYLLQPVPDPARERECDLVVDLPAHLISSWHPDGEPCDLGQCQQGHEGLHGAVLAAGGHPLGHGVAMPSDSSWFEQVLLVGQLSDEQAVAVGRQLGQAAVVRWDSSELVVLRTGLRKDIAPNRSAWRLTPVGRTCPMRRDDDPVAKCQVYGGPYGSTAIHSAALWQAHRSVGTGLLGCEPCRSMADPVDGPWGNARGAISLAPMVIGSRYGGYTWSP